MRVSLVALVLVGACGFLGSTLQAQTQVVPASNSAAAKADPNKQLNKQNANAPAEAAPVQNSDMAVMKLLERIELYHTVKSIKGAANLSGSTTMMVLGKAWADRFRMFHTEVAFAKGPDGTDAGIRALAEDPTLIVGSSRPVTEAEIASLKAGKCKEPLSIIVALDPLALYVHESNPLAAISPEQLEAILRAPGQKGKSITTWGELGITGKLEKEPVRIHSRSEVSGTKAFIKQFILRGEEVAKEVQSHESNEDICEAIAKDPAGVGIAGFGDAKPGVRAVSLSLRGMTIPANDQSFMAGQYPLVRPLVLLFDKAQMKSDGGLREEMLRYILSRDGQMEAIRAGFYPLDPSFIHKELDDICGPRMR